jgi:DNA invertase Pin-like site-specific DNA recombinase
MIYGYIRVSTDKQTTENQRYEILKYAAEKKLSPDFHSSIMQLIDK